jgi:ribose/xylose/arabinose/galactoside ABC-type transport system permease subunit
VSAASDNGPSKEGLVIRSVSRWRRGQIAQVAVAPVCVGVSLFVFFFLSPGELSTSNLRDLLGQAAPLAIVAIGQMIVIITRGFDLSVGSVAGLSAVAIALGVNWIGPVGILFGPIAGLACGVVSGVLVGRLRIQPLIATLGMLSMARGFALVFSGDKAVVINGSDPLNSLGYGHVFGVPSGFALAAVVAIVATVVLSRMRGGRRLYMVGSNPEAAELTGVRSSQTILGAYAATGLCVGIAALVLVGRAGAGLPTDGQGLELQTIAAAVIGGVSLTGGVGRAGIVLVGALFIESLTNGLTLAGYSPFVQEIILGVVILIAGLADRVIRRVAAPRHFKEVSNA